MANVLGEIHGGWRVARTMLAFERQALSGMGSGGGRQGGFNALVAEAQARQGRRTPGVRRPPGPLRIRQMVLRYLTGYLQAQERAQAATAATASLLKLAMARLVQDTARVAVSIAGHGRRRVGSVRAGGGRW